MLTRYEVRTTIGAWDEKWVSRVSFLHSSIFFACFALASSILLSLIRVTYPYLVLDSSISDK
jgi:hypothetical protein